MPRLDHGAPQDFPRFGRRVAVLGVLAVAIACGQAVSAGGAGGQPAVSLDLGGADGDCTVSGRSSGGAPDGGADAECSASAPVDYARDVAPIWGSCAGEVCHQFALSSLRVWIGAPADECCNQRDLIVPGHPERSYLIDKLEGKRLCYGARMPLERSALPAAEIATLKAWVCAGALLP